MWKAIVSACLVAAASTAHGQSTATNCNVFGNTVSCNSRPSGIDTSMYPQAPTNQPSFGDMYYLGQAWAADRERRRQTQAAEAAQAQAYLYKILNNEI